MQLIPIEIATKFNSEAQPGRHAANETPFIQNARLEQGVVVKDFGYSLVKRYASGSVLGVFVYDTNKAIIAYTATRGLANASFELWNMSTDTYTALTWQNGLNFLSGWDNTTKKYADICFTNHYDVRVTRDVVVTFSNTGSGTEDDWVNIPYRPYYPIGASIVFATTDTLPSGLTAGTTYYIGPKTFTGQYFLYNSRANALNNGTTGRIALSNTGTGVHYATVGTISTYTSGGTETTVNELCPNDATIITNGVANPLIFFHGTTTLYSLISPLPDPTVSTLKCGAQLKAKLVASLKDVLYWAQLTYYDTAASKKIFNHRAVWSKIKDIAYYNEWDQYFDFTQGGDAITGLKTVSGSLMVARQNSIWTNAGGYGVFAPVPDADGTDSPFSMADFRGRLVYNSYGKVIVLGESQPHLSEPIHDLFASEAKSSTVRTAVDEYNQIVYLSAGKKLFAFDFKHGTWSFHTFDDIIKVVGMGAPRAESGATVWESDKDNNLSVAEESTLSDPILIVGENQIFRRNHFYNNVIAGTGTNTTQPFTSIYETPLIPLTPDLGYGVVSSLVIEGEGSGWQVRAVYSDTIKKPDFEATSTVQGNTVFTNGVAQIDITSGRCKYVAFQLRNSGTTYSKISRLGILMSKAGRR